MATVQEQLETELKNLYSNETLINAIRENNLTKVIAFFKKNNISINVLLDGNYHSQQAMVLFKEITPIYLALIIGAFDVFKWLLRQGADTDIKCDYEISYLEDKTESYQNMFFDSPIATAIMQLINIEKKFSKKLNLKVATGVFLGKKFSEKLNLKVMAGVFLGNDVDFYKGEEPLQEFCKTIAALQGLFYGETYLKSILKSHQGLLVDYPDDVVVNICLIFAEKELYQAKEATFFSFLSSRLFLFFSKEEPNFKTLSYLRRALGINPDMTIKFLEAMKNKNLINEGFLNKVLGSKNPELQADLETELPEYNKKI